MAGREEIRITQSEWEVMRILWDAPRPLSATEVTRQLEGKASWKPKTVRTFLNRLVKKAAVSAIKQDVHGVELLHYGPLTDETTTIRAEQETFLGRFFGGTVQSMLASCIQSGEISKDELRELRKMIDREVGNDGET